MVSDELDLKLTASGGSFPEVKWWWSSDTVMESKSTLTCELHACSLFIHVLVTKKTLFWPWSKQSVFYKRTCKIYVRSIYIYTHGECNPLSSCVNQITILVKTVLQSNNFIFALCRIVRVEISIPKFFLPELFICVHFCCW